MTFGVVLYAKNVSLVPAFHAAVLDAPTAVARGYTTVDAPGFQLVVEVPEALAATITVTVPPQRRQNTPVKITLPVADIALARQVAQRLLRRSWDLAITSDFD